MKSMMYTVLMGACLAFSIPSALAGENGTSDAEMSRDFRGVVTQDQDVGVIGGDCQRCQVYDAGRHSHLKAEQEAISNRGLLRDHDSNH